MLTIHRIYRTLRARNTFSVFGTLAKISQILRVSLDDLVFGEAEISNNMIKILALTLEDKNPEKVKVFLKQSVPSLIKLTNSNQKCPMMIINTSQGIFIAAVCFNFKVFSQFKITFAFLRNLRIIVLGKSRNGKKLYKYIYKEQAL